MNRAADLQVYRWFSCTRRDASIS